MAKQPKRTPLGRSRRAELGVIDYTLAKRALLRDAQVGVLGLTDICDAHPELIRAARHVGEPTRNDCPVCGKVKLVLLAYVYGDDLREQNGRVWSHRHRPEARGRAPGRRVPRRRGLHRLPVEPPPRVVHRAPPGHRHRLIRARRPAPARPIGEPSPSRQRITTEASPRYPLPDARGAQPPG